MTTDNRKIKSNRALVAMIIILFAIGLTLSAAFFLSHQCGDCDTRLLGQHGTELCVACTANKKWRGALFGGLCSFNLSLVGPSFFVLIFILFVALTLLKTPIVKRDRMNN